MLAADARKARRRRSATLTDSYLVLDNLDHCVHSPLTSPSSRNDDTNDLRSCTVKPRDFAELYPDVVDERLRTVAAYPPEISDEDAGLPPAGRIRCEVGKHTGTLLLLWSLTGRVGGGSGRTSGTLERPDTLRSRRFGVLRQRVGSILMHRRTPRAVWRPRPDRRRGPAPRVSRAPHGGWRLRSRRPLRRGPGPTAQRRAGAGRR